MCTERAKKPATAAREILQLIVSQNNIKISVDIGELDVLRNRCSVSNCLRSDLP